MLVIGIDPIAFSIGPLTVTWYGITVALAAIVLFAITFRELKRLGISGDIMYGLFPCGIIGAIIGARLFHVVDYWDYYVTHPGEIIGFAGLSLYGAIIGAVVAALIYVTVKKMSFSSLAVLGDAAAVGAPLAQAIGRVGCTINGCCFGKPSPFHSFPGAVIYTARDAIPRYWDGLHLYQDGATIPLYPTQIYFLFWNLIVFAVVWRLRDRLKPQGSLVLLYLCLYAAGDFGLRFFRLNEPFLFGLHQGQVISLIILVVALPLLVMRMRKFRQGASVAASANEPNYLEQSREG
ncbi:MAG: prolipoprotein diacylglyceryl transferase [Dehalococcoidia bacterium]|nr:MAG: prolipoprotein diacylglyceryl transferase [Dehalococcoidia bacterium]